MPPKAKISSDVYIVIASSVDSVHATIEAAKERAAEIKGKVEVQELQGGNITIEDQKPAAKSKKAAEPATAPKTKPASEQRAENAKKPTKPADENLDDDIKALLSSTSDTLAGLIIVVTGIPPTIGRKNAEKLVENHGGKLGKSITGKTSLVVLGNDAGPKKLEEIERLSIETVDEDGLIERLEAGGAASKRGVGEDDEAKKPAKKQKK